jgi:hypothetical protein
VNPATWTAIVLMALAVAAMLVGGRREKQRKRAGRTHDRLGDMLTGAALVFALSSIVPAFTGAAWGAQ